MSGGPLAPQAALFLVGQGPRETGWIQSPTFHSLPQPSALGSHSRHPTAAPDLVSEGWAFESLWRQADQVISRPLVAGMHQNSSHVEALVRQNREERRRGAEGGVQSVHPPGAPGGEAAMFARATQTLAVVTSAPRPDQRSMVVTL